VPAIGFVLASRSHDAVIRVYDEAGNVIERPICTPLTFDSREQAAIAQREAT